MEMRIYYKQHLAKLETPAFVRWFESWEGTEDAFPPEPNDLLERYWSERRYALLGWHAALLPNAVSSTKRTFVRTLRIDA